MKVTSGALVSQSGTRLLGISVLVSLALGIAFALLLVPGSVAADGQDEFTAPIVLKEGRTPPEVTEPPRAPAPPQARTTVEPPSVPVPPQVRTVVYPPIVPPPPQVQTEVEPTSVPPPPQVQRDEVQGRGVTITQTAGTLVSNTGQGGTGNIAMGIDTAQPFTTGSNAAGYTLTRIDMNMRATSGQPSYSVYIAEDSSGLPGSSLGTLKKPTTLQNSFSTKDFSASGDGIDLDATSTYWVVIDVHTTSNTSHVKGTGSDAEDSGAASGWEIGNNRSVRGHLQSTWGSGSDTTVAMIKVVGYANSNEPAVLTSGEINGATLVLTFDSKLDTTSVPAAGRFTIEAGGSSHAATGISISGRQVRLTVPAVKASQFVTVSYRRAGGNPLKGSNGKAVATFSKQAVTNNTQSPPGVPQPRAPITYTEDGETREVGVFSADRDTLYSYFVSECTHQRSVPSALRDYSWFNADGHRMMARNGWRWVEVQNANGDVTHTRPMTISECASLKMYHRQAFCAQYADDQGPNEQKICPTNRNW